MTVREAVRLGVRWVRRPDWPAGTFWELRGTLRDCVITAFAGFAAAGEGLADLSGAGEPIWTGFYDLDGRLCPGEGIQFLPDGRLAADAAVAPSRRAVRDGADFVAFELHGEVG